MPTVMADNPEALLGLRIMTLLHRQQKSVYALAKHAGLPVKTVQRICKGEGKQPSVWTIAAMARVLGVSMDDSLGCCFTQPALSATNPREDTRQKRHPSASAPTRPLLWASGVTCPAWNVGKKHLKSKSHGEDTPPWPYRISTHSNARGIRHSTSQAVHTRTVRTSLPM